MFNNILWVIKEYKYHEKDHSDINCYLFDIEWYYIYYQQFLFVLLMILHLGVFHAILWDNLYHESLDLQDNLLALSLLFLLVGLRG
jgi:hypothetical protein